MAREKRDLRLKKIFMIILNSNIQKVISQEAYKLFLVKREALINLIILPSKHSQPKIPIIWNF